MAKKGDNKIKKHHYQEIIVIIILLIGISICLILSWQKANSEVENVQKSVDETENSTESIIESSEESIPENLVENTKEEIKETETKDTETKEIVYTLEEVRERLLKSQVQIVAGNLSGSGVIFELTDKEIVIISCKHLFEESTDATILLVDGQYVIGHAIYFDPEHDIAIVVVSANQLKGSGRLLIDSIKKQWKKETQLVNGEEVYILGSVTDIGSNLEKGYIAGMNVYLPEFEESLMWGYAEIVPGMSGGGIFDASGSYLGVLTGGNEEGQFVGISTDYVLEAVKQFKKEQT